MPRCEAQVPVRYGIQTIAYEQQHPPTAEVCGLKADYQCGKCGKPLCTAHTLAYNPPPNSTQQNGEKFHRYYCRSCHPDETIRQQPESLVLIKPSS